MKPSSCRLLALLALLGASSAQDAQELVSRECLGCICEAATGCDVNIGCRGGLCGPFLIGEAFFNDSQLSLEPDYKQYSFEECTRDPFCSAAVIRKYMARFQFDCNKDSKINCYDYAMVHQGGPGGCKSNAPHIRQSDFWKKLEACLAYFPGA